MGSTTAPTGTSSLFDDEDFAPEKPKQAPVEAVVKVPKRKQVKDAKGVDDRPYNIHYKVWTDEDTIALRERLNKEREEREKRNREATP